MMAIRKKRKKAAKKKLPYKGRKVVKKTREVIPDTDVVVEVSLPEKHRRVLLAVAEQCGVSVSTVVSVILAMYVVSFEKE